MLNTHTLLKSRAVPHLKFKFSTMQLTLEEKRAISTHNHRAAMCAHTPSLVELPPTPHPTAPGQPRAELSCQCDPQLLTLKLQGADGTQM